MMTVTRACFASWHRTNGPVGRSGSLLRWTLAVAALGLGALTLAAARAAGAGTTAEGVPGIVDIYTNIAYAAPGSSTVLASAMRMRGGSGGARVMAPDSRANPALLGEETAGTGIVLTSSGTILTNNVVVRGALTVLVKDAQTDAVYSGVVVGYDVSADVAVVQLLRASGLTPAILGPSAPVNVGEPITTLGNADGAGRLATETGTITALGQSITAIDPGWSEQLSGLIQTDVRLQPGDSGGPLVNASGQVIGMNTASAKGFYTQAPAISYSIPIATAVAIAHQILAGKSSAAIHTGPTAFLGVTVSTEPSGLYIADIVPGSPLEKAGLAPSDVITSLDGQTLTSTNQLTTLLLTYKPGATVTLGWLDTAGAPHSATIQLGSGPPQ